MSAGTGRQTCPYFCLAHVAGERDYRSGPQSVLSLPFTSTPNGCASIKFRQADVHQNHIVLPCGEGPHRALPVLDDIDVVDATIQKAAYQTRRVRTILSQ